MTTTIKIQDWIREGTAQGAKAMLVVWDEFPTPPEAFPEFIAPGEDITQRFTEFESAKWQRVTAIYLLN